MVVEDLSGAQPASVRSDPRLADLSIEAAWPASPPKARHEWASEEITNEMKEKHEEHIWLFRKVKDTS